MNKKDKYFITLWITWIITVTILFVVYQSIAMYVNFGFVLLFGIFAYTNVFTNFFKEKSND